MHCFLDFFLWLSSKTLSFWQVHLIIILFACPLSQAFWATRGSVRHATWGVSTVVHCQGSVVAPFPSSGVVGKKTGFLTRAVHFRWYNRNHERISWCGVSKFHESPYLCLSWASKHLSECDGAIRHSNLFFRVTDFFRFVRLRRKHNETKLDVGMSIHPVTTVRSENNYTPED